MIRAQNLCKSYGGRTLFEQATFSIDTRQRVGLVGRNGHGKTTLLRLITGHEHPDSGHIAVPKGYRIGYVRQEIAFSQASVLAEGARGLVPEERDQLWRVEKILTGLGFSDRDFSRDPHSFSGGFQVRLNLAKVLVSEPDLLLLDEPTNYLDITSIRWISRFLKTWPRELLLVTHDRGFMDQVVTHVLGIHRCKTRKVSGTTDKYYALLAQEEEVYEKTRLNDERRRREIELFISRFRAKARLANLVQSRIKTLSKLEKRHKLEALKTLEFSFRSQPFRSRRMLQVEDLAFAYPGQPPLMQGFGISVGAGERIAVIGRNGRGKTTLLKMLAGTLKPTAGRIRYNPAVVKGVFEQTHLKTLVDSRTVEEEILYAHPDISRQQARNISGAVLFPGDEAEKKISVLSGGEKSRVMLGKLLAVPVNLLLLDEPTNHLDMAACDALLAAIDNFDGTVIMVTHNEMFLHALARRLIVFTSGGPVVFDGSYQRFLDAGGFDDAGAAAPARDGRLQRPEDPRGRKVSKANRKEMRRRRSELIARRGRALKPLCDEIHSVEQRIESLEARLETLSKEVNQASLAQDGDRIGSLSQQIHKSSGQRDELYERLEDLYQRRERTESEFSRLMAQLASS